MGDEDEGGVGGGARADGVSQSSQQQQQQQQQRQQRQQQRRTLPWKDALSARIVPRPHEVASAAIFIASKAGIQDPLPPVNAAALATRFCQELGFPELTGKAPLRSVIPRDTIPH